MTRFSDQFAKVFRRLLPSPFSIAVVLTTVAFLIAILFGEDASVEITFKNWERGLWNPPLLVFAFQMMLMLVLGHVLALTKPAEKLISSLSSSMLKSKFGPAMWVALLTMLTGLFNWGFGLVFGAILARKVGEEASRRSLPINYPLIGAAGYTGLLVWHGGISGSSLIKVAEEGHLATLMSGVLSDQELALLPSSIGLSDTVFSTMNIVAACLVLTVVAGYFWLRSGKETQVLDLTQDETAINEPASLKAEGAEKLDQGWGLATLFGVLMIIVAIWKAVSSTDFTALKWINPNWINLLLFGLCLLFHRRVSHFLKALESAISGASGILIQFPLYFGIMGIITGSGLIHSFSEGLVAASNQLTYPIYTFFSAAVVNVFVPSGGGQWAVQGALIVKAAMELDIPLSKCILAMAYGDQVTNMLQPFWALPLLGITGLKAKQILPYTLSAMLLAMGVFVVCLIVF